MDQISRENSEAMQMVGEMRKSHIHEVRLLQRGLAMRGSDKSMQNRVNETADLVDKLGRAVVQRDEAIRDKTKLQSQSTRTDNDMRALTLDCGRLKKENKQLKDRLKEALRKAKFVPPRPQGEPLDDSDEEFETELTAFEKRFQILEEGPAGLDILASNLSRDKRQLEQRLKKDQEEKGKLADEIAILKRNSIEKDQQINDLSDKLEEAMRHQAMVEEQIASKRREIEMQVADEKEVLERKIRELEEECDNARAATDGMEKVSNRLTTELVKVHETYTQQTAARVTEREAVPSASAEAAGADVAVTEAGLPATEEAVGSTPLPAAPSEEVLVKSSSQPAKTGEMLNLRVVRIGDLHELRACEEDGEEFRLPVSDELISELDQDDKWEDLFRRVGVSPGPPRQVVISRRLGESQMTFPSGESGLFTAYRYDARRFFLSVVLFTGDVKQIIVKEDSLQSALSETLDVCENDVILLQALAGALSLDEGSGELSLRAV